MMISTFIIFCRDFASLLIEIQPIAIVILFLFGALAQLVERNNGIVEVNGSTPLRSIYSLSLCEKRVLKLTFFCSLSFLYC